jgi:hypothetical protein
VRTQRDVPSSLRTTYQRPCNSHGGAICVGCLVGVASLHCIRYALHVVAQVLKLANLLAHDRPRAGAKWATKTRRQVPSPSPASGGPAAITQRTFNEISEVRPCQLRGSLFNRHIRLSSMVTSTATRQHAEPWLTFERRLVSESGSFVRRAGCRRRSSLTPPAST